MKQKNHKEKNSGTAAVAANSVAGDGGSRKLVITLIIISAVIAVIAAAVFIGEETNLFWKLRDRFDRKSVELVPVSPKTEKKELGELLELENTVYDESLMLINSSYRLADGYSPDVSEYNDSGVIMNNAIKDAYKALADDIKVLYGNRLYVMSAYRTPEEQEEAIKTEGDKAAGVGESEHQAGLALDVYISQYAGGGFIDSDVGKYVNSHCDRYGFIIRYPYWGSKVTGFAYEPWHIRYVGYPHAGIIMSNMITLEEYIEMLEPGVFYSFGDYIISRQKSDDLRVPSEYESLVISPDNTGYLILTALVNTADK